MPRDASLSDSKFWNGGHEWVKVEKKLCNLSRHDYEQLFGVGFRPGMDKAQRLLYGESQMTHAMSLTACHETGVSVSWQGVSVCQGGE